MLRNNTYHGQFPEKLAHKVRSSVDLKVHQPVMFCGISDRSPDLSIDHYFWSERSTGCYLGALVFSAVLSELLGRYAQARSHGDPSVQTDPLNCPHGQVPSCS
jgi:hypothetical protein